MIYIFGGAFDPPHSGHASIIRAILYFKNPDKIVIIPSSERDDKKYKTTDFHRLKMLELFVEDIRDERVIVDDFFVKNWHGEMITKDVDEYARKKYGENLVHIFGTDTMASMPDWDAEKYAAEKIAKIFIPRDGFLDKMQFQENEGRFFPSASIKTPHDKGDNKLSKTPPQLGGQGGCVWISHQFNKNLNQNIWTQFISPKQHEYLKKYANDLRKNQTPPEYIMWKQIFSSKKFLGYKVLRQHILWKYIVDFYIHKLKLIIEIDGDIHSEKQEKDRKRDEFFQKNSYSVIRIPAFEVLYNLDWVYEFLVEYVTHPLNPPKLGGNMHENVENLDKIKNYSIFSETHFPMISSTEIRAKIPEYTHISRLYDDNLKKFKIPGLSQKVSLYILENRLYRDHLPKEKLLVHVCCGPDVVMPILQMRDEYDLVCFWYDPNIQPRKEYDKRFEAFKKVCEIENIPFIKGAYDVKTFFKRIKWVEFTPEKTGEKCTRCYDMRMFVAAKLAKKLGIPNYTTSLNTSPKKDLDKMFFMGHKYAQKYGIKFLDIPFRKRGWFAISAEYTKKHDIYRQNYCGCVFSIRGECGGNAG